MDDINFLFKKRIIWQRVKDENGRWFAVIDLERYELHMNDFPDESLFTLSYNEKTVNFDDAPLIWFIPYKK